MTQKLKRRLPIYRLLTGPDDLTFCHRVTEALSLGWILYGSPAITYDQAKSRMICAQAVTKEVDDIDYHPDLELSKQ